MWPFRKGALGLLWRSWLGGRADEKLGPHGEQLARQGLCDKGLRILASNYRCPSGEADLIALDESTRSSLGAETIVFVEVKTRTNDQYLPPQAAVDDAKRSQMRKVANYYLLTHDTAGYYRRFDIVAITIRQGQEPCIEHIADAFE